MKSAIKTGVVPEFRGDYFFLSNHDVHEPFKWRGEFFDCGERAFVFGKGFFMNKTGSEHASNDYFADVLTAKTPADLKALGRSVDIDIDQWNASKVTYMREITAQKYRQVPNYAGKLINTGAMMLVEGNDWGDKFWGRCLDKTSGKMVGLNTLGVILMEERGRWLHQAYLETIVR